MWLTFVAHFIFLVKSTDPWFWGIQQAFCRNLKANSKLYVDTQKTQSRTILKKKIETEGLTLPDFKTYKATVIKKV